MRATLLGLAFVLLASSLPQPAAAAGACSGSWSGSASCAFACSGRLLTVAGVALAGQAVANVTVSARCGIVLPSGAFIALVGVSCSESAPRAAACSNSALLPAELRGLTGRCTVAGWAFGNFSCAAK